MNPHLNVRSLPKILNFTSDMTSKWVTYRLRYRKYLTVPRTRVRLSTANFIHNAQGQTFPILSYRTSQTVDTKNKSFLDSRVTFLVGPTFFHIITLNRPAGSTWSRWDNQSTSAVLVNQSMRKCCWIGQKFGKGVNNFLIYSYFEKGCRRKNVHATIPKGNMGLLNSAFVSYEELWRSRRVLSASVYRLDG